MEHSGGLGSRLHHRGGNEYIAYAQWPDRETRERSDLPESIKDGASKIMRDCCETIETLYELTPVADYLIPANVKDR